MKRPQRKAFAITKNAWTRHAWTDEEQNLWAVYSKNRPIYNRKRETVFMTNYNAFLSVNIPRALIDLPMLYTPPAL